MRSTIRYAMPVIPRGSYDTGPDTDLADRGDLQILRPRES